MTMPLIFVEWFHLEAIEFTQPLWLWLILLWPILGLWRFFRPGLDDLAQLQMQRQMMVKHPLIHRMEITRQPKVDIKRAFSGFKLLLQLLRGGMIIALAFALAQPVKIEPSKPLPQQKTVRDIVFVIESSASFLLPDYQVAGQAETRMNVVKTVLDQFISGLSGNRFALMLYAEKAYTLMPLTDDQTAARLNLNRLKPYLAGRTDNAMGEALGLALKQTEQAIASDSGDTLRRVVVLISDGLSKPSTLNVAEAIHYAQMMNVPIYTIGVGASSAAADKRLYTGLLYQPLESASLKQIAAETQGQYYQIGSGEDLVEVLQQIDRSEGVPYETPPQPPQRLAMYYWPLSVAVLSLFGYLWLSILGVAWLEGKKVTSEHQMRSQEEAL